MSAKFKLTFTGSYEALFRVLSKLLPDDLNVEVEEMSGQPLPAMPHDWKHDWKLDKPKPTLVREQTGKTYYRQTRGPNLKKGINGIVMRTLADGMGHQTGELKKLLKHGGYSPSSLESRLTDLRARGVIEHIGDGQTSAWRMTEGLVKLEDEKTDAHLP